MPNKTILLSVIWIALLVGCSESERLARLAENSVEQQRSQNEEMTKLNREIAQGVSQMVESEHESRQALTALQQDIQQQLADVDKERSELESERKQIASQRIRESLLAPVISNIGLLAICGLPLILAWYLVHAWYGESHEDHAVGELLIQELTADQPSLLPLPPGTPAISHREQNLLAQADSTDSSDDDTQ